jgi:hypothetical protein
MQEILTKALLIINFSVIGRLFQSRHLILQKTRLNENLKVCFLNVFSGSPLQNFSTSELQNRVSETIFRNIGKNLGSQQEYIFITTIIFSKI